MIIQCLKDKLKEAVTKAEKTANNNPSLPILTCILIQAKGSNLTLRSTNLDVGVEVSLSCKVEREGEIAVPASLFKNVLSSLQGDNKLDIRTEGNTLVISTGTTVSTLVSYETADFPTLPRIEEAVDLVVSSSLFISGLKSVVYSTAQSSMKPEFSSVYLYINESSLVFVATDSFRLAESTKYLKQRVEFEPILIPYRNVIEIIRLFEGVDDEIKISLSKTQLSLSHSLLYVTSRLVESSYPDYQQIIPKEHTTHITVSKKDFENALKMSTLFSDKFNKVKFNIKPDQSIFEISSSNASLGESVSNLVAKMEGEDILVHFNERYISDVLSSLKGDILSISLTQNRPMIIKDMSDGTFQYLVMPVAG